LAVLDFVGIEYGESASASVAGAVSVAQAAEAAGYRRYWVSEHHNVTSLACSAPDERPELFVLGSSGYGPRFAAVNGMSAVFAHHMSPR
jgi:alkanesulfonate monooxygenase SsuD/methylene tetrahydromethanopterin reductase-like flavin-dependent oxidoreductase (luciferase family)